MTQSLEEPVECLLLAFIERMLKIGGTNQPQTLRGAVNIDLIQPRIVVVQVKGT